MNRVYPFTNENVASFNTLYNFSNAKVLSVLGSGDQYFSSLLFGAKDIELYDCNSLAWDYFVLKYYGIMILSYEEFYRYFVKKRLNDEKIFKRILPYLPIDVANRLCNIYKENGGLSYWLYLPHDIYNEQGQNIIYFDREKYYQLQSMLLNRTLPNFYLTTLSKLPNQVSNKTYDIILTSNIFDWIFRYQDKDDIQDDIQIYKELLNRFNFSEIQALYRWNKICDEFKIELEKNGFDIERVPCARRLTLGNKDTVISLRKK